MTAWCSLSESRLPSCKKGRLQNAGNVLFFYQDETSRNPDEKPYPVGRVMLTNYQSGGILDERERFL